MAFGIAILFSYIKTVIVKKLLCQIDLCFFVMGGVKKYDIIYDIVIILIVR